MNANLYCQQLNRVTEKFKGKQDRIYYLHDKARYPIAKSIRENLLKLERITIPHPPYSPALTPTYHYLFRSVPNHLRDRKFADANDVKIDLFNFLYQKSKDFYEHGILSLPERWQ